MARSYFILSVAAAGFLAFAGTAFGAAAATPDGGSLLDLLRPVYEAALGHHWWLAVSLALVFACAAVKRYAPGKLGRWANRDAGGAALVLVGSFGTALAAGLVSAGTDALTLALAWAALKVAIGAAGGYSLIKKLLVDPLLATEWYKSKAPAWLRSVIDLALWAFTRPTPTEKAEAAGDTAVVAKPPAGAEGPAGKATEV